MTTSFQTQTNPGEEIFPLINLAETAVLTSNLEELTRKTFPEMTGLTCSESSFLYVDDPRLLAPQLYPYQISLEETANLEDFCKDQFAWFVKEDSKYPLIISVDWHAGERFHLYPLRVESGPFGMVGFIAQRAYISGNKDLWVRFLQLFSVMVNNLIERGQSERQLSHLNTYLNVSAMLSQPLGLHEILEAVLYCSMDVVSAEAASVLLLDEDRQNFLFYQAEGPAKPILDAITFPTDKGLAGSIYHTQTAEIINDVSRDPRFFGRVDSETGYQTRNMIALPLTAGEERVGVLEVINKVGGEDYNEDELMLLVSIADEIAFAIRNARIFEYVVDSYCLQRQGLATCRGCRRPLGSWTPCVKYRQELD
jgi:GAF domain-containing protein